MDNRKHNSSSNVTHQQWCWCPFFPTGCSNCHIFLPPTSRIVVHYGICATTTTIRMESRFDKVEKLHIMAGVAWTTGNQSGSQPIIFMNKFVFMMHDGTKESLPAAGCWLTRAQTLFQKRKHGSSSKRYEMGHDSISSVFQIIQDHPHRFFLH